MTTRPRPSANNASPRFFATAARGTEDLLAGIDPAARKIVDGKIAKADANRPKIVGKD